MSAIAKKRVTAYNTPMSTSFIEALYPLHFHQKDALVLSDHLKRRQSVNLVGMKRVGIGNFLRFFFSHSETLQTYLGKNWEKQLFILIDLNDLLELEILPFWTLTFKRIVDASERYQFSDDVKNKVEALFLDSIRLQNTFLLIENIRKALILMTESGMMPTLFFLRFDRMKNAINLSFFDNLESLRHATQEKVAYVFTSYRELDKLFAAEKAGLAIHTHTTYFKPANENDMEIIYNAYSKRYPLSLTKSLKSSLFTTVGGHNQYLQLAMVILGENGEKKVTSEDELVTLLTNDERIMMQSEELWESLTSNEQKTIAKILDKQELSFEEKIKAEYLWEAGFILEEKHEQVVFSLLFSHYITHREKKEAEPTVHFTKKEHSLFTFLENKKGEICEREEIIEAVWPEYKELEVSDWAIDRLVARVRVKLRQQNSPYEIVTVRTRGYKLSPITE